MVLDELDHIASTPSSLTSLLSLPKSAATKLRVIGIANTHTLTSSSDSSSTTDSSSVKTLHFAPYNSSQLLSILQTRLAPLLEGEEREAANKFLPQPSKLLLTKKVASLTGDVRVLLEVLRGAIDKAISEPTSEDSSSPVVKTSHVLDAFNAYAPASGAPQTNAAGCNSEIVVKIKNLGLQARLVLLAILLATRRLGSQLPLTLSSSSIKPQAKPSPSSSIAGSCTAMDVAQLHGFYTSVLSRSDAGAFSPVGRSEFGDVLGMLEGAGLVSLSTPSTATPAGKGGKRAFARSASFGGSKTQGQAQVARLVEDTRVEEALRGLGVGVGIVPSDIKEEEVKAIWERELVRLGRELKGKNIKKTTDDADVFHDATKGR